MPKQETMFSYPPSAGEIPLPTIETVAQVTTLLATSNERLIELQHEATNVALTEISLRQSEMITAISKVADILPGPHLHHANAQRVVEVMRAWFEVVTETQTELIALMGESFLSRAQRPERSAAPAASISPADRRHMSVVIDFPDRRIAA